MENNFNTIIGENTKFVGEVTLEKDLLICGSFEGNISSTADIEIRGCFKGDIKCVNLTLYGKAEGTAVCSDCLSVIPGGEFTGDITAKNLDMKESSVFDGTIKMLR